MIVLWATSVLLRSEKKNYFITLVPAVFMSAVSFTYFLMAEECLGAFGVTKAVAYPLGLLVALALLGFFILKGKRQNPLK